MKFKYINYFLQTSIPDNCHPCVDLNIFSEFGSDAVWIRTEHQSRKDEVYAPAPRDDAASQQEADQFFELRRRQAGDAGPTSASGIEGR